MLVSCHAIGNFDIDEDLGLIIGPFEGPALSARISQLNDGCDVVMKTKEA